MDGEPKRPLRERKKEQQRDAILLEGLRLFRKQGYSQTTLKEIADAANTSVATVVRYFPSKDQILLFYEYDALALVRAYSQTHRHATMAEGLEGLLALGATNIDKRGDRMAIAIADHEGPQMIASLRAHYNKVLEDYFASYLPKTRAGRFRAKVLGAILTSINFAGFEFWIEEGRNLDLIAMQREVMAEFLDTYVQQATQGETPRAKKR